MTSTRRGLLAALSTFLLITGLTAPVSATPPDDRDHAMGSQIRKHGGHGKPTDMGTVAMVAGIDVSSWQGNVDWNYWWNQETVRLTGVGTVTGRVSNGVRQRVSVPAASVFAGGENQAAGPVTGTCCTENVSAAGSGVPSGGSIARSGWETVNGRGGGVSPGLARQSPVKRPPRTG